MYKILSINAGSSSLKFKLYEMPEEIVLCSGIAERIGHEDGIFSIKKDGNKKEIILPLKDHNDAVAILLKSLIDDHIIKSFDEISAIGNRIVQGGDLFKGSCLVNDEVKEKISSLIPLAPLHNHAHLIGINAFQKALPDVPQVVVFDTSFHQTMEEEDYLFPIPYEYSIKYHCRRYGAHGTSHRYLSQLGTKEYLKGIEHPCIISCHIGSGASITAIKDGKCVATSMGLTPLGGIMMGTRTGDLDPSVMNYLCSCTGKSTEEMFQIFNKKSGFLGVSGISDDSRDILKASDEGNKQAILANKLFVRRICDFIGQYYVRLGKVDLIIFSAGIGENAGYYREKVCEQLEPTLGVKIDKELNSKIRGKDVLISTKASKVKVAIIPTDEEVMIARDTYNIVFNK
jgi:acetate kinase